MTRGGTDRRNTCLRAARAIQRSQLDLRAARAIRRLQLYGDSPASQSFVPITSALFESCLRNPTRSQLEQRLASSIRGTAMRLPFGSTVESWLPRPSACPRPSPYAVPRVDGASRHRSQAPSVGIARAALKPSTIPRHSREETLQAPCRMLLAH
jgi:hypothetical protein